MRAVHGRAVRRVSLGRPQEWIPVELLDEETCLPAPGPVKRVRTTDEVLIACTGDGRPRAISAWCPHRRLPLALYARPGRQPGTLVCTAHQCEFDLDTGERLAGSPLCEPVPPLPCWPLLPGADGSFIIEIPEDQP
jgi:nitrite reductase/ring-hydroxylating ferredoxin subunit